MPARCTIASGLWAAFSTNPWFVTSPGVTPPHLLYGISTVGRPTTGTPVPQKEEAMPTYSFECRKCKKKFLEILSFSEYEEGKRKCPKCGSKDVFQVLETFYAKTSRKS